MAWLRLTEITRAGRQEIVVGSKTITKVAPAKHGGTHIYSPRPVTDTGQSVSLVRLVDATPEAVEAMIAAGQR